MSVDPVAISRSALDVEWQRMQTIAQNLANENTTRVPGGGAYRPVRLVSGPERSFALTMTDGAARMHPAGVKVLGLQALTDAPRRVLDPGNPYADGGGYVDYPGVDHAAEMALLVKTARVYEANLTALSMAQQMNMRALEIGKR
jgi:flagellar basal-body rod protein FlgC